jgi:hypothetical protein
MNVILNAFRRNVSFLSCFLHAPIQMCTKPQKRAKCTIDLAGMQPKNTFSLSFTGVRNNKNMAPIQTMPNKKMRRFKDLDIIQSMKRMLQRQVSLKLLLRSTF